MSAADVTLALAFVVFIHATAGLVGHIVLARHAFLGAARTEGGRIARMVLDRDQRFASEAAEPVSWMLAVLTPYVLALLVRPRWLAEQAWQADGHEARAFVVHRRRLYVFALCAIVSGGAFYELAPVMA